MKMDEEKSEEERLEELEKEAEAAAEELEELKEERAKKTEKKGEAGKVGEKEDCLFCRIVKGEVPSGKVYEGDNFIGILDINPKADGHTIIISKRHFKDILDMPSSLGGELLDVIKKVGLDLLSKGKGEGLNIAINVREASGQIVPHVHVHIVPRKLGDGLKAIA